ncbi:BTAD domain-containing putative transcriptional regulator [Streptomyces sp. SAJ15]|uniref:AfsR/SARP family transcriptional regulator n=1 Tax=Streptomyces sp. SAJ15 TaxID=2011095 RepID=UPI0011859E85|nr:BTAD domain-containing putative transcriptional regulator [Streptomyces sp. SAJ15]TVL90598.1 regulator [Streptomyces sp. SAJ15]
MEFRILGPVEAFADGGRVGLGHAKQRSVLAVLLLEAGRVVSVDQLIDRVWSEDPPGAVRNVLYGYVARLRAVLRTGGAERAGVRLARRSGGYVLETDPRNVDVHRFRALVAEARRTGGDDARAAALLREALGLWRGEALVGLSGDWLDATREQLGAEHLAALLARNDVELRLGHHGELLAELRALVTAHPLDERVVRQLMVALYRCERQAEALEAYERTRERLAEGLGVDPGPELRALHQRILRNDLAPAGAAVAPAPPAVRPREPGGTTRLIPAELPRMVPGFSGRAADLATLDSLARCYGRGDGPGTLDPGAVVISAIAGTAGVGKTALAVHWGHRVRDRFPDGQLYVDLRGFDRDREPLSPRAALAQLLCGLGLTSQEIPADEEEQIRRYRSLLVDRRMLIVLDDAVSAEQVRPLLPGGRSCFVVVTSRNRLRGLVARDGAHPLRLDVLAAGEAHDLLTAVLGRARVAAEPDAAAELARLCGYLPLALRVAAAQLVCEPDRDIADLAAELAEGSRLAVLELEDDEPSAVRAAFELSYRALSPEARLLFRRLGLVPGLEFAAGAAAALLDGTEREAARLLRHLATAHLIESHGEDRYGFHDLLREYACELCAAVEREEDLTAARDRLYAWYLLGADAAGDLLYPQVPRLPRQVAGAAGPAPSEGTASDGPAGAGSTASGGPAGARGAAVGSPPGGAEDTGPSGPHFAPDTPVLAIPPVRDPVVFADEREAIEWLAGERSHLLAVAERAAKEGPHAVSWHLADSLFAYFWLSLPRDSWQAISQAAMDAAASVGDRRGEAAMCSNVGVALREVGQVGAAASYLRRALELHRAIGWPIGEARALAGLGHVAWEQARLDDALAHHSQAVGMLREHGQWGGEALALVGVGLIHRDMGRLDLAIEQLETALQISRDCGVRYETNHLDTLGIAYWEAGRLREALKVLDEALAVNDAVGYHNGRAVALLFRGRVHVELGRYDEGRAQGERALRLALDTGHRRIQADALNTIGEAHRGLGRADLAAAAHARALAAARAAQNLRAVADSVLALAVTGRLLRRYDEAETRVGEALAMARRSGFRVVEGQALTESAELHAALGEHERARAAAEEALAVHRETGHLLGEARTLAVLSRALRALGDSPEADSAWRRARRIVAETGARQLDD